MWWGGSCERCKVQIVEGQVSKSTVEEESALTTIEVEQGYRLACMAYPLSNVKLHVPQESLTAHQRTQVEGLDVDIEPDPLVRGYDAKLSQPTLASPQADAQNLWQILAAQGIEAEIIDFRVQQALSQQLRENDWQVKVALRGNEIIAIGTPSTCWLGMAADIGTTKIAGYLLDLETGKTLASKGLMNPQISYGEDVISRIVAASKSLADAAKLQSLLSEVLSKLAEELCTEIGVQPTEIVEAVVVGNTAIHHLFLGLPVKQLGLAPYAPATDAP